MKSESNNNSATKISLTVKPDRMSLFSSLLGQGFTLKILTGISVRDLLCRQIGVRDDYLDQRIQTIFLDGKVVDNVDTAVIRQGSTLALSAAMPGLAGATLRRGSAYAAMRNQITHQKGTCGESTKDGTICLKLFNLVAADIGQLFLEKGILISGKYFGDLFRSAPDKIISGVRSGEVDGVRMSTDQIVSMDWEQTQVFLKLEAV